MKRRTLLKLATAGALGAGLWPVWRRPAPVSRPQTLPEPAPVISPPARPQPAAPDLAERIRRFDEDLPGDVFLPETQRPVLTATLARLERVRRQVGHGNFALLDFDRMLAVARHHGPVGAFTGAELDFMEMIFALDARRLGFAGPKVLTRLTDRIPRRAAVKVPGTGNYLYRNDSLDLYHRLRRDVGETLILTSGIRGIVKQMHLFLAKAARTGGNLSRASRSLAPPGHSFHGIGDFDVGRVGLGAANFTARFAETEEFRRLRQLDYVSIRYPEDNTVGVRYEPWHVRVVSA